MSSDPSLRLSERNSYPRPSGRHADPQFTIVTTVHDGARNLRGFIASVEAQTHPGELVEVIAVDDGSSDESRVLLAAWKERRPELVTLVTQRHSGRSAARNHGLHLAAGQWVTFADPGDRLSPSYLAEVATFVAEHPSVQCMASRVLVLDERTGEQVDSHPLRRNFMDGNLVRDLANDPSRVYDDAASGFYSSAELRRQRLRFHPRLSGAVADAHFCARFLLELDRPEIGYVATASYLARWRGWRTFRGQDALSPDRGSAALLDGLLDLLLEGARRSVNGRAPTWLQHLVTYELSWFLTENDAQSGPQIEMTEAVLNDFHRAMGDVIGHVGIDTILGFTARRLRPVWRDLLLHGYATEPWHQDSELVAGQDADQCLIRIAYRYTGDPPIERLSSGGQPLQPMHSKIREISFFGRVLMRERIFWASSREPLRLQLSGRDMNVQPPPSDLGDAPGPGRDGRRRKMRSGAVRTRTGLSLGERFHARLARTRLARGLYGRAWVLMDRIADAQDNGEHLFRFMRSSHPEINAWFVLDPSSHDWRRLRREFGLRVVPHGSVRWKLLMANCRHFISSHVDAVVIRPPDLIRVAKPKWRFTFLQHGVIQSDLSRWLNPKQIDVFVTSTLGEIESIAGDHSTYVFTTKEVKLTGLPRFDRLTELGRAIPEDQRDLVLIAPTWRAKLAPTARPGSHQRTIPPAFQTSDFARSWKSVLASSALAAACRDRRLTIGFLPHPNLQSAVPQMDLPDHIRAFTFAHNDVQELFARAAVLVTDYSSVAFDVAYIERPIVYFQFDRELALGGEHVGRHGYFDYERDGFGPVAHTADEAVRLTIDLLGAGKPRALYLGRIDATFPARDGRCRERVLAEILRSTHPLTSAEASTPHITPRPPSHPPGAW